MTTAAMPRGVAMDGTTQVRGAAARLSPLALMAGAFFASYHTWRPFEFLFTISDAFFCAGGLLLLAGAGLQARRPFGALTPWWLIAFLMMSLGLLIGSIANGEPLRWAIAMAQYGFAFVVLPFLLLGHGRAFAVALAKAAVAGMVAMEALGIAVYFFFSGTFEQNEQRFGPDFITGSKRLGAFLADGNWNGCIIAMTLPILAYLYQKRLVPGWMAVIGGLILLQALVLAASVTGLSCALAAGLVMVVAGKLRPPRIAVVGAAAGLALYIAAGAPLPQAFDARVAPALQSGNVQQAGTFEIRYELINEALTIVENTSLVGLGVDQYREVSAMLAPVHNMYLLVWAEGGLLALFGWLGMIVMLIYLFLQTMRRDRATGALGLAVLTSFVTASTASPHMYARLWIVPLLVALAFMYECNTDNRGESE